jgi:hypothetical protein
MPIERTNPSELFYHLTLLQNMPLHQIEKKNLGLTDKLSGCENKQPLAT